jgi:hypothetical protein
VLLFPAYLALAVLIYLGDKDAINAFFYRLFVWLHIPVRSPHGWNYSAFLALLQTGIMIKYPRHLYCCGDISIINILSGLLSYPARVSYHGVLSVSLYNARKSYACWKQKICSLQRAYCAI